jgi:hypothetical protein
VVDVVVELLELVPDTPAEVVLTAPMLPAAPRSTPATLLVSVLLFVLQIEVPAVGPEDTTDPSFADVP